NFFAKSGPNRCFTSSGVSVIMLSPKNSLTKESAITLFIAFDIDRERGHQPDRVRISHAV
ncbi:MAG: hypothetical protein WC015_06590, partial [Methanoregula sp.]